MKFKTWEEISISQSNNHNHFTGKKSRFLTPKRKKKIKKKKSHVNKYYAERKVIKNNENGL